MNGTATLAASTRSTPRVETTTAIPAELIRIEDVYKTYHVGEVDVPVLNGVSLTIRRGEFVALMGASGSGKTTLMNILGCLDHPSSGTYWLTGEDLSAMSANQRAVVRATRLGFVFQNFNLLPRTSALSNILMPFDYAPRRPSERAAMLRAEELLERVGLADRMDHVPAQMSGGQQQRVAIARSLVHRPPLLLADEPTGNLDSKTSAEILRMFEQLNDEGITIILVTHDADVASHARRIIRLCDGRIESDSLNERRPKGAEAGASSLIAREGDSPSPSQTVPPVRTRRHGWTLPLVPQTLRTALRALLRNKMRSVLTTLGVIIGVGAVIAMMEIGQGSRTAMQQSIASMGANLLMILPGAASSGGVTFGGGSVTTLSPQDAEEIGRQCPAVSEVALIVRARTQVVYGNRNWVPLVICGTTPEFLKIRDWDQLDEGEPFTERDVRSGSKVCLIGQTLSRELFPDQSPVGKEIRLQNVSFRILGVLERKGGTATGLDQDDIVLAPWTTIKYRVSGNTLANVNQSTSGSRDVTQPVNSLSGLYPAAQPRYPLQSAIQMANTPQPVRFTNVDQILVKATSTSEIPLAIQQITALLSDRHRIRPAQAPDFNIRDMTEVTKSLSSTSDLMSSLLLAVALISLVVGGVGIMNIMLVSVTERTREIGLRMAVGARASHILRQFLVEAVLLCLLGGAVGILAGLGSSYLVRTLLHWPTETSLPAIVAAVTVSASVGIIFGFYPAWKASGLDPIEALRYE